jgi:hypothetical protein
MDKNAEIVPANKNKQLAWSTTEAVKMFDGIRFIF